VCCLLVLVFASLMCPSWAEHCNPGFKYNPAMKECSGPPFKDDGKCLPGYVKGASGLCVGPPFDCPGQPGFHRVFAPGSDDKTICTNEEWVDPDAHNQCPAGYFYTSIAAHPYNDVCVHEPASAQPRAEEEKRIRFAEQQTLEYKQLYSDKPDKQATITAEGPEHRTLLFSRSFSIQEAYEYFTGGEGYREMVYRKGFRIIAVCCTDRNTYYAAKLTPSGNVRTFGPMLSEDIPDIARLAREEQRERDKTRFLGMYIGENVHDAAVTHSGCSFDFDLEAALKKILTGKSEACSIWVSQGKVYEVLEFIARPETTEMASLELKYGKPWPGKYRMLSGDPVPTTTHWRMKDGTEIDAQPGVNKYVGYPKVYYTLVLAHE
jgi:hypothetical protein